MLACTTELKAMQDLDAVMHCDTEVSSSFTQLSVARLAKYVFFFPALGSILRLVGPSLRLCRIIFNLECLRNVVLHSRVISPCQPPSMVLEVYVLARRKFQDPRN